MAMMAKMRNLAPAFILLVGGIFVLFMVISDSRVLQIFGQSSNNVGSVNGVDITYKEFQNYLDQARERQKSQTGRDVEEDQLDALNDQVWESVVNQELLKEQIEKYNIKVTDQEINDIIFSANPPAFLKNQFIDSLGRFNHQLYESTILRQKKEVLVAIEDQVRQMQLTQKLQNYLFASISISESEIKRKFEDQNTRIKAEYLMATINTMPDNEVTVSNDDIKAYYEKHTDEFKVAHQRKIKYVTFSKLASKGDSLSVRNNLEAIANKAKNDTASFKSYIDIYSEQPYGKDTVKQSSLAPESAALLASGQPGQVLGPVANYDGYNIYKLIAKVPSKDTYVRASHILIPLGSDENKAREEAMNIYNRLIAGEDFAKLAKEKSTDPGSAQKGGDLGWFGKGRMVKEFEEACFNGKIGEIQKPVKTNFGFHIIKVTGKSSSDYVVEKIVNKVKVSGSTIENAYSSAGDFAFVADENGFDSEAKLLNYPVQETPLFAEDAFAIPGLGINKSLIQWVFDNDINDISPVYKVRQGYIVAQISGIEKAGVKKFEDVEKSIKPLVINEKKLEKAKSIIEKAYNQVKSSGNLTSASLSEKLTYDTTGAFSPSGAIPKLGRDFAFMNKAEGMDVNKISEPVKGARGYYIIKVTEKTPFNSAMYSMQRNSLRDNLLQEKKSYFFEQWLNELKKNADIVDNRNKMYR